MAEGMTIPSRNEDRELDPGVFPNTSRKNSSLWSTYYMQGISCHAACV